MRNNLSYHNDKTNTLRICALCFTLTASVLTIILYLFDYAPFGCNTLATMDAWIQYVDFYAYLKDVIVGKNNILYSFTVGLGQSNIGNFAYYLASPVNLILIFFTGSNIYAFFNLSAVIKMSLAAFTMSYYLQKRFSQKIDSIFVVLLSLSFALMQYNIAQSSNVMWLDGVYMLPLIILGVYRLIREEKVWPLSVAVGFAILIQWYTAGISCLFCIVWFFFETALYFTHNKPQFSKFIKKLFLYGYSMLSGVFISAVLFLPTYLALRSGKGSHFDWNSFKNVFNGNIISTVSSYSIGAKSSSTTVALFAGSLVLICVVCLFRSSMPKIRKALYAGLLCFSVMIFYWQPLFLLFSLLTNAGSYWFRYSYISIFSLIYMAAVFLSEKDFVKTQRKNFIKTALLFSGLLFILNYFDESGCSQNIYYTAIYAILISAVLYIITSGNKTGKQTIGFVLLTVLVITELSTNATMLMEAYHRTDGYEFSVYTAQERDQIGAIQESDDGNYRITQTSTRSKRDNNLTANYNEAQAYNYKGLASYTSCPENLQLSLMSKLGYRVEGDCITVVNTSILPVDSLLGVKYVLSSYGIDGLVLKPECPSVDTKEVYYNPYAFPIAFVSANNANEVKSKSHFKVHNPFEYVNTLYSQICGEDTEVFYKIPISVENNGNSEIYKIDTSNVNGPIYGNIPWSKTLNASIDVNGEYTQAYSTWLSPSVFYIPYSSQDTEAVVKITSETNLEIADRQFYAVDMEVLEEVSRLTKNNEPENLIIENGKISCYVNSETTENLLLSVINSDGWKATVNGVQVSIDNFADSLMRIPLSAGENHIELRYSLPGGKIGLLISVLGIIMTVLASILHFRKTSFSDTSKSQRKDRLKETVFTAVIILAVTALLTGIYAGKGNDPDAYVPMEKVWSVEEGNIKSREIEGMLFEVNDDGSIAVSGQGNTEKTTFTLINKNRDKFYLKSGRYYLKGCPSGGDMNTYRIWFSNDDKSIVCFDTGEGIYIDIKRKTKISCSIDVLPGVAMDNVLFTPEIYKLN